MIHCHLKKTFLKNCSGFTIIEVMIAIAVLSIGILGMASMQITSTKGNSTAKKLTSNSTMGINQAEQIMKLDYDHADITGSIYDPQATPLQSLKDHLAANIGVGLHQPTADSDGLDNDNDGQIDEAGETGNMNIEWQVVQDFPILDSKRIEITVSQGVGLSRKTVSIVFYKINTI